MTQRNIHPDLVNMLLPDPVTGEYTPFVYAHLVKFEKPRKTETGKSAETSRDYAYITDGSTDVEFDDGSADIRGNLNSSQNYIANRLLSVGAISESTEARASSLTLKLSSESLNTTLLSRLTLLNTTLISEDDLVASGFSEGDAITITASGALNDEVEFRLDSFSGDNKIAQVTLLNADSFVAETNILYTLTYSSDEVAALFSDKSSDNFTGYINREVFIYKAHMNPETGEIIGEPYLLFKGILASGNLVDSPESNSIISWSITSHWGDFIRVNGRLTSDSTHRALNGSGVPDRDALVRPEYANDLGFQHSEKSLNIISKYQEKETRYKLKSSGGFLGFGKSYKQVEYQVDVDREVDLRFSLDAKYLPVVYGVRKIDAIPVFADTLKDDASTIYVAYALCEGEIGGLYDIYFDENSSICIDENDNDTRSTQTDENNIDTICIGRMDRGDTLSSNTYQSGIPFLIPNLNLGTIGGATWNHFSALSEYEIDEALNNFRPINQFPGGVSTYESATSGITHEKGYGVTASEAPIEANFSVHTGKASQQPSELLAGIAADNNFKIQSDYFSEGSYWGSNHRMLDTAYVVGEFKIAAGETTIPELDFVVRGKILDCYNYDYSYVQDLSHPTDDISFFSAGDVVNLRDSSTNTIIESDVVIAAIERNTASDGKFEDRIRFVEAPNLGSVTAFYVQKGLDTFHVTTYDHVASSGIVSRQFLEEVSTLVSSGSGLGIDVSLNNPDATFDQGAFYSDYQALLPGSTRDIQIRNGYANMSASEYDSGFSILRNIGQTDIGVTSSVLSHVILKDVIALEATESAIDDAYVGFVIELTQIFDDNTTLIQHRKIVDYDGTTKVAKVDHPWDVKGLPDAGDSYKIGAQGDRRVSTNPAIQTLDYLTNERYGRGLDKDKDLSLPSFLDSARVCDTRSDVTVSLPATATISVGDVYKYEDQNGKLRFQGEVKTTEIINTTDVETFLEVTFTNVIGKICSKWNNWKKFEDAEIIWHNNEIYEVNPGGVPITVAPIGASAVTMSLLRVQGSGDASILIDTAYSNFEGNPVVKSHTRDLVFNTGYSLYDADEVTYWRYLGWPAQDQQYVTRHQTNVVLNTSSSVFDNINSLLSHFNGMLRDSNGKYELAIKTASDTIDDVQIINESDIVGDIKVEDQGQKGTMNTVSVSIPDPQNRFESRSITLFNSDYLKQDRGVPKKGDIKTPYITNYYNGRLNAKQYLEQSRYGMKISFTLPPKGILLLSGSLIRLNNTRFKWVNKEFRITNLSIQEDCLVRVVAEEHNRGSFLVNGKGDTSLPSSPATNAPQGVPLPVTGVTASSNRISGILLNWTNPTTFNTSTHTVEVWRSEDNNFANALLVGTSKGENYTDQILNSTDVTLYYWLRVSAVRTIAGKIKEMFSLYSPLSSTSGVEGIALEISAASGSDGFSIDLSKSAILVSAGSDGVPNSLSNTDIDITAFIGTTQILYDESNPYTSPSFRVGNITYSAGIGPGAESSGIDTFSIGDITSMTATTGSIVIPVTLRDSLGNEVTINKTVSLAKTVAGASGAEGRSVSLSGTNAFGYNDSGTSPDPLNSVIQASAFNTTGIVFYEFFLNGNSVQNTTSSTYTYTPTASYADMPETVTVSIRENSNNSAILASDSLAVLALRDYIDGQPGIGALTAIISNETHTVPASDTGVVSSYLGSGTEVKLYEGTTQLNFDGTGAANGTFDVSVAGTNIFAGTISDSGSFATINPHSFMTQDVASVEITITGKRANGSAISIVKTQSITKSKQGAEGDPGTPGLNSKNIELYKVGTSTPSKPTGTFTYTFSTDTLTGGTLDGWSRLRSAPAEGESLYITAAAASSVTDTDSIPSSEFSTVIPISSSGTSGFSNSLVTLFRKSTSSTIEPTSPTGSFTYIFSTNSLTGGSLNGWSQTQPSLLDGEYTWAIQASAVSTSNSVSINSSNFSTGVVISSRIKGIQGEPGINGRVVSVVADTNAFAYNNSGLTPVPASTTVTASAYNTEGTVYYHFSIDGSTVQNTTSSTYTYNPPTNFASLPQTIKVNIREDSSLGPILASDSMSIVGLKDSIDGVGIDALTLVLSNEAHVLPATDTGNVTSYAGSGTTIRLFEGIDEVLYQQGSTANNRFSVSIASTGITEGSRVDSGSFLTIQDHSFMNSDQASIVYNITGKRANGDPISLTKTQSFSKSKEGGQGPTGQAGLNSKTIDLYQAGASAPADPTGTFSYTFSTNSLTGGSLNGWARTASNPPTGQNLYLISAQASSNTDIDSSIPASEFSNPVAISSTGPTGSDGLSRSVVTLFRANTSNVSSPTRPSGTFTYTFANNDIFVNLGSLNGWTQNQPSLSEGQYMWVIQASLASSSASLQFTDIGFSGAVLLSSNIKGDQGTGGAGWFDSLASVTAGGRVAVLNDIYTENGLAFKYDGSVFQPIPAFIDGDLLVNGAAIAKKVFAQDVTVANTIQAEKGGTLVSMSTVNEYPLSVVSNDRLIFAVKDGAGVFDGSIINDYSIEGTSLAQSAIDLITGSFGIPLPQSGGLSEASLANIKGGQMGIVETFPHGSSPISVTATVNAYNGNVGSYTISQIQTDLVLERSPAGANIWSAVDSETNATAEISDFTEEGFTTVFATLKVVLSYTDSGLSTGDYDFRVRSSGVGSKIGTFSGTLRVQEQGVGGTTSVAAASTTSLGGVKLFTNTDQAQAINPVSNTASRTYAIQLDALDRAVVNVPWSDTTTSVSTSLTSTSTTVAASSSAVKQANDNANGRLPLGGGTLTGNLLLQDDVQLRLGNNIDTVAYHNGTSGFFINNTGNFSYRNTVPSGYLDMRATNLSGVLHSGLRVGGDAEVFVRLYYQSLERLRTTSDGVELTGNLDLGSVQLDTSTTRAGVLKVSNTTGSWTGIEIGDNLNGSDRWSLMSTEASSINSVGFYSETSSKWVWRAYTNGAMQLMFSGATKLSTTVGGVDVNGALSTSGNLSVAGSGSFDGNQVNIQGTSPRLQLTESTDTGNPWYLIVDGNAFSLRNTNTSNLKFRVTSTGDATVYGDLEITGRLSGVSELEFTNGFDLASLDTRWLAVQSASSTESGIEFRNSANSVYGRLRATSSIIGLYNTNGGAGLVCNNGAETQLFHNAALKLATTANGVVVYGNVSNVDFLAFSASNLLYIGDSRWVIHRSSNATETGMEFQTSTGTQCGRVRAFVDRIGLYTRSSDRVIEGTDNGEVRVYFNDAVKLATTASGVNVSGNLTATGNIFGAEVTETSALAKKNVDYRISIDESLANVVAIGKLGAAIGTLKDDESEKVQRWFIADEVEQYIPEAIEYMNGEVDGLKYTRMLPDAYAAISKQQEIIEAQQTKIDSLEARLERLEKLLGNS